MRKLQQEEKAGIDYTHKETFQWIAMNRLPEFVTKKEFDWQLKKPQKRNMKVDKYIKNTIMLNINKKYKKIEILYKI